MDISLTVPPNQEAFKVVGHCSPHYTQEAIDSDGITVFGSMLHSHKSVKYLEVEYTNLAGDFKKE